MPHVWDTFRVPLWLVLNRHNIYIYTYIYIYIHILIYTQYYIILYILFYHQVYHIIQVINVVLKPMLTWRSAIEKPSLRGTAWNISWDQQHSNHPKGSIYLDVHPTCGWSKFFHSRRRRRWPVEHDIWWPREAMISGVIPLYAIIFEETSILVGFFLHKEPVFR